jgi:hypothetical protein
MVVGNLLRWRPMHIVITTCKIAMLLGDGIVNRATRPCTRLGSDGREHLKNLPCARPFKSGCQLDM